MIYYYEALDSQGIEVKEEIEADSIKAGVQKIRDKGFFPTKIREKEGQKPQPKPKQSLMQMFIDQIRNVWNKH